MNVPHYVPPLLFHSVSLLAGVALAGPTHPRQQSTDTTGSTAVNRRPNDIVLGSTFDRQRPPASQEMF